jgi:hypothetical protein
MTVPKNEDGKKQSISELPSQPPNSPKLPPTASISGKIPSCGWQLSVIIFETSRLLRRIFFYTLIRQTLRHPKVVIWNKNKKILPLFRPQP